MRRRITRIIVRCGDESGTIGRQRSGIYCRLSPLPVRAADGNRPTQSRNGASRPVSPLGGSEEPDRYFPTDAYANPG